ncbi:MAG: formylglycine-generating enzyme family protein [Sulfuricurvum sp.]
MKKIVLSLALLSALAWSEDYINSIGMKFKDIPSGSFIMGTQTQSTASCPKDDPFTDTNEYQACVKSRTGHISTNETPAHRVSVNSFYMAETEVTQGQWYEVMGNNPSYFKTGDRNMPVEKVSWDDAQRFIKKLNTKEGTTKYRLPTEEEWEYAARAGTSTQWYCGNSESCVNSIAVYDTDSPNTVKSKRANDFGLYDMSGNVWEWTKSCYTENYNSGCYKNDKSYRGGGWGNYAVNTRSALRYVNTPDYRHYVIGFRLLRTK